MQGSNCFRSSFSLDITVQTKRIVSIVTICILLYVSVSLFFVAMMNELR